MPQIVWTADAAGARDLLQPALVRVHGHDRSRSRRGTRGRASRTRTTCRPTLRAPRADARRRRASSRSSTASAPPTARTAGTSAAPCRSATSDGEIDFWIGTATDIDDRKRIEEAQRFLLDAGAQLVALARLARRRSQAVAKLAVPRIADWCAVDIVERGRRDRTLAIEHADPQKIVVRAGAAGALPARARQTRAARPG